MEKVVTYSERFDDDDGWSYRYVILSDTMCNDYRIATRQYRSLLHENDWRKLGIQMSRGWVHCWFFPSNIEHVLVFRRKT